MAKNRKNVPPAAAVPAPIAFSSISSLLAWCCLGWAIFALVVYWNQFASLLRWPGAPPLSSAPVDASVFGKDAWSVFLLATTLAGATAAGSLILRAFRLSWNSLLEELVLSIGMGLAALGYLIFVIGILQLYRPPVFWGIWIGGLVLFVWRFKGSGLFNRTAVAVNRSYAQLGAWKLHAALLAIILAWAGLMGFVPDIFYDSMVYHLGAPRWYLFEGGIKYMAFIHTQFPFLRQMLNVFGLALEGERLAKLLHGSSALLIVATYKAMAQRYSTPKTALIAALAFFTMPMVNLNLWSAGIDVGLAAFSLLAFYAWSNGMTDRTQRTRWFAVAGLFLGFCLATKYPAAMLVGSLCLTTLIWLTFVEKQFAAALRASIGIGLLAVAVMSPWLIKSWVMTGNPVYPYLHGVFGGKDLNPQLIATFFGEARNGATTSLWDLLKAPWTETLQGISSYTAPGVFLLGFIGFLFLGVAKKEFRTPAYTAGLIAFLFYWFGINSVSTMLRFAFPGLVVGCFLIGHIAAVVYARSGKLFRAILLGVIGVSALAGAMSVISTLYTSYAPWNVLVGRESAAEYLSYTHSGMDPYPATRMFIEARPLIPSGQHLLIIGDEKVSTAAEPFLASGAYNESLIVQWAKAAKTPEELAERFKKEKVSHVLINPSEAARLYAYQLFNWDNRSLGLYSVFFEKYLKQVGSDNIPEKYNSPPLPLVLYEFQSTPQPKPLTANWLLELHEHFIGPTTGPDAIRLRKNLMEGIDQAYPGSMLVHQRVAYWRAQAAKI